MPDKEFEEDFFQEGEEPPEVEERWRPAVICPQCGQSETRFLERSYEISTYQCEACGGRFEYDDGEG